MSKQIKAKAESATAKTNSTNTTRKAVDTYTIKYGDREVSYTKIVNERYRKLVVSESSYKEYKAGSFDLPITLNAMHNDHKITATEYINDFYDYYTSFVTAFLKVNTEATEANAFVAFINYIYKYLKQFNDLELEKYRQALSADIADYVKTNIVTLETESAKEKAQLRAEYEAKKLEAEKAKEAEEAKAKKAKAKKANSKKTKESEQSGSQA